MKLKLLFVVILVGLLIAPGQFPLSVLVQAQTEPVQVTMTDLGTLGGLNSEAIAINELGQVVGESGIAVQAIQAFVWSRQSGMLNLGTLGGTSSSAQFINNLGQVVGSSKTASGETHAFLWTEEGGMVDLGTLGGDRSWVRDMNELGQVVGWSLRASGEQYTTDSHAFVWTEQNGMIDLGTLGGTSSQALAINILGQVVGRSTTIPEDPYSYHAFLVTPVDTDTDGVPDLWNRDINGDGLNDLMIDLGTLGGEISRASDINDLGMVVGYSYIVSDVEYSRHAFLWTEQEGMIDIGPFDRPESTATHINNRGEILGYIDRAELDHPFLWTEEDGFIEIPRWVEEIEGYDGFHHYNDINSIGQVVGISNVANRRTHAFVWSAGAEMLDLGTLEVDRSSWAVAINNVGEVVGEAYVPGRRQHAFFWSEESGMIEIGTFGGDKTDVNDVNDLGVAVGSSNYPPDSSHAFLWTEEGGMVDIGTLGGDQTWVYKINDIGQVLGRSHTILGATPLFLWSEEGGMVDLTILGAAFGGAVTMNNLGQLVGQSIAGLGEPHAFLWTEQEGMIDLGTLWFHDASSAREINNLRQVIGTSYRVIIHTLGFEPFEFEWGRVEYEDRAFFWSDETGMINLGTLEERDASGPSDINDLGQVVGNSWNEEWIDSVFWSIPMPVDTRAFFWTREGGMIDIGTLGGDHSWARAINDLGQVVGSSNTASGETHAFLWTEQDGLIDLGTLGGTSSSAQFINNLGQVVGSSKTASGETHAFLWTEQGGMVDLGTLGGDRSWARAINDLGQVVGSSNTASGETHAVVWTVQSVGVVIIESGGSTDVVEGDASDTYTVKLMSEPASDVEFTVLPGSQVTVSPGTLTFTPDNWNEVQTVTVVAVDDSVYEGVHTGIITHLTSSIDPAYDGITIRDVTVNIADNDTPGNTLTGTDVRVDLDGVSVTFSEVTGAGDTTMTVSTTNPGGGLASFRFLGTWYDIDSTATYDGPVTVCITYDDSGISAGRERNLKIFHWDGTDWVDVTSSLDTDNNIICGTVSSLSWFGVALEEECLWWILLVLVVIVVVILVFLFVKKKKVKKIQIKDATRAQ